MFPTDITFPEVISIDTGENNSARVGRSFIFDYSKGQHIMTDGKPKETTELEAIKQWLELLVRTSLEKYAVYDDTGFGTTWDRYIGYRQLPKGFIASELEREIQENCNKYCPAIERITDFSAVRLTDGLEVSFTAELTNKDVLGVKVSV